MTPDTHDTHDTPDAAELSDALRWQLRALRQDQPPSVDLWPDIAARLTARTGEAGTAAFALPGAPARPSLPAPGALRWRRSRLPVALAASVLVAVGTLGLLRHGGPPVDGQGADAPALASAAGALRLPATHAASTGHGAQPGTTDTPLALAEAEGLRLQYEGAIRELETRPGAAAPNPTLRTLDQSAALILTALRQAPDSTRLLEQLRRTYQRRLDLMRLPLA